MEQQEAAESAMEALPPLPVYESTQSKSVNLNELIKIHRTRQRYEIVDKFFNNSYISIENKLQPIQVYYQNDMFKSYLEDINLVYFKDIEFSQNVRLEYVLRRINFTLNGQNFNFRQHLQESKFYDEVTSIFTDEYLQSLEDNTNEKKVLELRNSLNLCLIINQLNRYAFSPIQYKRITEQITRIYKEIHQKINQTNYLKDSEEDFQSHHYQCAVKSVTNLSDKSPEKQEEHENESDILNYVNDYIQNNEVKQIKTVEQSDNLEKLNYFYDDMIYQEEIDLKIVEIELENYYFDNQINELTLEQDKAKLKYLLEINKEYLIKLKQLRQINNNNREIVKKIQKNLKVELNTGVKCIVIDNSDNLTQCFGKRTKAQSVNEQNELKLQKIIDSECIQKSLLQMITKLKLRLIADAIQKVYEIQREDSRNSKNNNGSLIFSVSFQHGFGISEATFSEKDFLILNELRQQSTLTSYLTPMKSCYSYISHSIYTFLKLLEGDFSCDKNTNNNEDILRKIKNKISRHRNLGKSDIKDFYHDNFKICHNCKILCHKLFLRQCKKRVRHQKENECDDDQEGDDDSLYTQRNFRKRNSHQYIVQCQKNFCLYCIKNQFNGKIFNDKGWCPSCLDNCHCNTCLRQKILKKLTLLYRHVGGDQKNVKSEKQMIESMRIKIDEEDSNDQSCGNSSFCYRQLDDKIYESVIKKQLIKGFSAEQIDNSLYQQQEIIKLIIQRQKIKERSIFVGKQLFRQKISHFKANLNFQHLDRHAQEQKYRFQRQRQIERLKKQKQLKEQLLKRQLQKSSSNKYEQKRKCRMIRRDSQIYYEYYKYDNSDSDEQYSSFHHRQKKMRDKFYEPDYNF